MKAFVLALGLFSVSGLSAAPDQGKVNAAFRELLPGRYVIKIKGLQCRACAMALERNLARNERFAEVRADYAADEARFTVTPGPSVEFSELKGLIRRASRRNNLVDFEFVSIRYLP